MVQIIVQLSLTDLSRVFIFLILDSDKVGKTKQTHYCLQIAIVRTRY